MTEINRTAALELLKEYTKSENLLIHAYCVESVMKHFAAKWNEDVEKWGVIGLIHDLDYEQFPDQHCSKTKEILESANWPEDYIRAVLSHGWGLCTDVEPVEKMEKVLYATDELTGLIYATALVRPSKSIRDLTVKSVKKKWKQSSFAAGANRAVIQQGAEMLGMEREDLIFECIEGMKKEAELIGLA